MTIRAFVCSSENSTKSGYTRHLLDIEKNVDVCLFYTWLSENWTVCYYFICAYLVTIFLGQKWMKTRPPFQLGGTLVFWNVILAAFSTMAAWRMVSAMRYRVLKYGFHVSICNIGSSEHRQAVGLWMYLFTVSKFVEFGDTFFIVLRKTPLIFLHWYHHGTVAFFVWSSYISASAMHYYFSTTNLFVHSFMYWYYALKGIGIRVPKPVCMAITSLQLLQMVFGIFITGYMYWAKATDRTCQVSDLGLAIATTIYFSYLVLFLHFFIKTYVVKRKPIVGNGDIKKFD